MAKIEISLAEYNDYKRRIKNLEEALTDCHKELDVYKHKLGEIQELVEDLEDATIIDRTFHWSYLIKPFKDFFKK